MAAAAPSPKVIDRIRTAYLGIPEKYFPGKMVPDEIIITEPTEKEIASIHAVWEEARSKGTPIILTKEEEEAYTRVKWAPDGGIHTRMDNGVFKPARLPCYMGLCWGDSPLRKIVLPYLYAMDRYPMEIYGLYNALSAELHKKLSMYEESYSACSPGYTYTPHPGWHLFCPFDYLQRFLLPKYSSPADKLAASEKKKAAAEAEAEAEADARERNLWAYQARIAVIRRSLCLCCLAADELLASCVCRRCGTQEHVRAFPSPEAAEAYRQRVIEEEEARRRLAKEAQEMRIQAEMKKMRKLAVSSPANKEVELELTRIDGEIFAVKGAEVYQYDVDTESVGDYVGVYHQDTNTVSRHTSSSAAMASQKKIKSD
jgi:hypothetical protein